jgi:hypothetical protein
MIPAMAMRVTATDDAAADYLLRRAGLQPQWRIDHLHPMHRIAF